MSEPDKEVARNNRRLRNLLSAGGFTHHAGPSGRRQLTFSGQFREWLILAKLDSDWFHAYTFVCVLPAEAGLRGELLLWLARANAGIPLLKYSVTQFDHIVLEFEVRASRLEADDVASFIWFLHAKADKDYPAALRVATGEARLDALADAFKGDASAGEDSLDS